MSNQCKLPGWVVETKQKKQNRNPWLVTYSYKNKFLDFLFKVSILLDNKYSFCASMINKFNTPKI